MEIPAQEAFRTPNRQGQRRNPAYHITVKTLNMRTRENIESYKI
jgi:hypothetical protein